MTNLNIGSSTLFGVTTVASLSTTTPDSNAAPAQNLNSSLYPATDAGSHATPASGALWGEQVGQMADTQVILFRMKGDDAMQQVGPKAPAGSSSGGYQSNSVSRECQDGALANGFAAAGQLAGSELGPAGENLGGTLGREVGGMACEIADAIGGTFNTGPENVYDPSDYGNGGSCTDQGPTGGQSRGKDGGYSGAPEGPGGGFSSLGSYIDPETGEQITNKDGKTIAGDPNADQGTYIGEVDDPNFTNDDANSSGSSGSTSSSSQSTGTDSTQESSGTEETGETEETGDAGPKPDDDMPADDGSGSGGPAGPRSNVYSSSVEASSGAGWVYMPADDGSGEGTPRSDVANLPPSSSLHIVALSRSQLM
jgi:hypothetical protein